MSLPPRLEALARANLERARGRDIQIRTAAKEFLRQVRKTGGITRPECLTLGFSRRVVDAALARLVADGLVVRWSDSRGNWHYGLPKEEP